MAPQNGPGSTKIPFKSFTADSMKVLNFTKLKKLIITQKSFLQATYVTSLFPYLVLIVLFVRGITLEGAKEGIVYYLSPEWERLASATVSKLKMT